jgi:hypothetical protein
MRWRRNSPFRSWRLRAFVAECLPSLTSGPRLTGVSRDTLKEHFRKLVEKGYLAKQRGGRST